DLLHYPAGLRDIQLDAAGALDDARSFTTVNYMSALTNLHVRNSVRPELGVAPIAFSAAVLAPDETSRALVSAHAIAESTATAGSGAYLVYGSERSQLILLVRQAPGGEASIQVVPVASFDSDPSNGAVTLEAGAWRPGLPFGLVEDPDLDTR